MIAIAAPSAAAQAPARDSVVAEHLRHCFFGLDFCPTPADDVLVANVESGPAGETPTGTIRFASGFGRGRGSIDAGASCLKVTGHSAVIGFTGRFSSFDISSFFVVGSARLADLGGADSSRDTFDVSYDFTSHPEPGPTDCSSVSGGALGGSGANDLGDIVITDAQAEQALFGKTTNGSSFAALDHNDKYTSPFGLFQSRPATVTKLRAYLDGLGRTRGSQVLRGLIYRTTSSGPGALVAASSPVTIAAARPAGWVDFVFASPPTHAGGVYWLGLHAGNSKRVARYAFDLKPGGQRRNDDAFADGPLNPFGGSHRSRREISIHAIGR